MTERFLDGFGEVRALAGDDHQDLRERRAQAGQAKWSGLYAIIDGAIRPARALIDAVARQSRARPSPRCWWRPTPTTCRSSSTPADEARAQHRDRSRQTIPVMIDLRRERPAARGADRALARARRGAARRPRRSSAELFADARQLLRTGDRRQPGGDDRASIDQLSAKMTRARAAGAGDIRPHAGRRSTRRSRWSPRSS